MLVPKKEYTEQYLIDHNAPVDRYFEIDTQDGKENIIVEDTFKFTESGTNGGKVRFGLCSIPYFECQIKRTSQLEEGKIVSLYVITKNVNDSSDGDKVSIGEFLIAKSENTNIPNIYNIRGEANIEINKTFSDEQLFLMTHRRADTAEYRMTLYPLLVECFGNNYFKDEESATPTNPIVESIDFEVVSNADSSRWVLRCKLFAERVENMHSHYIGDYIRTFTSDNTSMYSFNSDKGKDISQALDIVSRNNVLSNIKKFDPLIIRYNAGSEGYSIYELFETSRGKKIFMADSESKADQFSSWAVVVPESLVFINHNGIENINNLELNKNIQCFRHRNWVTWHGPGWGLRIDRTIAIDDEFRFDFSAKSINLMEKVNNALEAYGVCSKISKRIVNKNMKYIIDIFQLPENIEYKTNLYPKNTSYPSSIKYPSYPMTQNKIAVYGEESFQERKYIDKNIKYGRIDCVFNTGWAKYDKRVYIQREDSDANYIYDMSDNSFFSETAWDEFDVEEIIKDGVAREAPKIDHYQMNVNVYGNPLLELWDKVEIIDPYNKKYRLQSRVVSRTLSGNQFMRDVIETRSNGVETMDKKTKYDGPVEEDPGEIPNN